MSSSRSIRTTSKFAGTNSDLMDKKRNAGKGVPLKLNWLFLEQVQKETDTDNGERYCCCCHDFLSAIGRFHDSVILIEIVSASLACQLIREVSCSAFGADNRFQLCLCRRLCRCGHGVHPLTSCVLNDRHLLDAEQVGLIRYYRNLSAK